jgi:hypothetical protein
MSRANTQQMFSILSSLAEKPAVNLHHFDKISAGFYSTMFSIPLDRDFKLADYNESIAGLTNNAFQIEPDSLLEVDNVKGNKVFKCILHANTESKPYNEENVKGLTSVKAGVFLDEQHDIIWKLVGGENDKRLVRMTEENFSAILEAKRSRNPVVASIGHVIPYSEGDYAYFFNTEISAMDFGYVVERENRKAC